MITYGSTTLTSYNSIVRTEVYYYKSTSATSLSGGSWATTKPTWENGKYIWQKIRTVYEDGTHTESDPVNITGQQGATGTAAYSYKLNSSDSIIGKTKDGEYTIKKITFSATYKQGTGAVSAYGGRFKIESTTNGSTWKTEYTSSGNEASKEFTIPDDIIAIKCSLYQSDGTTVLLDIVTIPVVKDGVDAIGLRDSIPYYLASDKDTGVTRLTQGWTRYRPQLTAEKKYLWVYYVSRYSEGTTEPELIEIKDGLVHFINNGDESPVESCVVDIEPKQDLNGYDHPWPAGGGANLFDIDNIKKVGGAYGLTTSIDGDVVRISGTYTGTTGGSSHRIIYHDQPIIENAKFVVFRLDTSSANVSLRYASTSDNSIVLGLSNITTNTDVDIRFRFVLYTGSTAPTTYTPYSNICPITGWTAAKVTRTGRNLFDQDNTSFLSGNVRSYGDSDKLALQQINTLPAGTYTLSFSEEFVSLNEIEPVGTRLGLYLRAVSNGAMFNVNAQSDIVMPSVGYKITKSVTFTLTEEYVGKFMYFYVYSGKNDAYGDPNKYTAVFSNIQLELGSTATDYEPYSGQTYDITFPTEAGTVYGGQLNVTTGELVVDRAMVVIDGVNKTVRENGVTSTTSNAWFSGAVGKAYGKNNFISDRFVTGIGIVPGGMSGRNNSTGVEFLLPADIPNNSPALNQWFADNPTQLCYELAEPITYHLTPQEITMLCQENNIWADTGQTAISYYDNQTSTDPYVDYSLTSAFDASTDALDKAKEVAQDLADLGADLQAQIDGKIETWCQITDPSTAWTTTELKNQHNGDLWYYTGESTSSYKNNTTYKYTASTNKWTAYSASTDLFDKIDAKTSIYYGKPSAITQNLEVGDYLVDSTDGCSYRWDGSKWVKLTDYNAAIDAIEVGGKNLLRGTKTQDTSLGNYKQNATAIDESLFGCTVFTSSVRWADIGFDFKKQILDRNLVKAGDSVTYSIWAKTDDTEPRNILGVWVGSYYSGTTIAVLSSEWTQYSKTFVITEEMLEATSAIQTRFECNTDCTEGKYIYWAAPKLERGTKATDWTPAPEDTEAEISALQEDLQSQIDEKIQTYYQSTNPASAWTTADIRATHDGDLWCYTGATTSTYTKDNVYRYNASNNTWTTYSASGDLFDKVDGKTTVFYGKTTDTFADVETGDYLVDATDGSSYRYDGSKWVKVTDYQAAIDKIEVGGRNYKRNSNFKDQLNKWNIWAGATVTIDENIENKNWAHVTMGTDKTYGGFSWELGKKTTADPMQIASGDEITISFDAQLIEGEGNAVVWLHYRSTESGTNLSQATQRFPLTEAITRFSHTFTVPTHSTYTVDTINVMIGIMDGTIKQGRFTNIKVEKGNRSTDWTPAPEDVDASISTAQTTADTAMDRATAIYGTCSTDSTVDAKVVICPDFVLFDGAHIQVTFTNANTASAPTLNVNSTGAKPIYINKTVTSSSNLLLWTAGSKMEFVYDGTGWIAQNVPYALYGTCSTEASTAAKAVTCNEAVICKGTTISVNMTNTNTAANATMNVGSTLAKDIYANGAKLTTNSRFNWRANTTQKFVFDGQVWRMDDDSVKALATAYITEIDDDGIMVHPEDDDTSGWAISDAIQLFKNGISYIKLWIENNIPKIRIGKEDQGHVVLDNDSVDVRNGDDVLATFGENTRIGTEDGTYLSLSTEGLIGSKNNLQYMQFLANGTSQAYGEIQHFAGSFNESSIEYTHRIKINESIRDYVIFKFQIESYIFRQQLDIKDSEESIIFEDSASYYQVVTRFISNSNYMECHHTLTRLNSQAPQARCTFDYTVIRQKQLPTFTLGTRVGNSDQGLWSYSEGLNNIASGDFSHVEGENNTASGSYAHAEGYNTVASGSYSHAGGDSTISDSYYTFVHGRYLISNNQAQAVFGQYNKRHGRTTYLFILGNGTGDEDEYRSDAFVVDDTGNIFLDINSSASSGTTDAKLYDAITALGWQNDIINNM